MARFEKGHVPWNKGKKGYKTQPCPEETKQKISKALIGLKRSEETKNKISKAMTGKKQSEKHRRSIGEAHKGKNHSEETKRKISESLMGNKLSEETKQKISEALEGRKLSEETKDKMSEAQMGHEVSEETIRKLSKAMKGRYIGPNSPNWRGGISNLPYAFDFNGELRELIKKRDGYRCHFPACGTDVDLAVHHIDYDKMNSDPRNLITLCMSHNSKVNGDREYWTNYFKEMT